jgi:hypothetical protein
MLACAEAAVPPARHVVNVSIAGNGTGSVVSAPTGISCAADCNESFEEGSSVSLTANAASGSVFMGWSGAACSGTGTCHLVVSSGASVTATFSLVQHELSVAMAGDGAGTVESEPAGISCGADCAQAYDHGTSITLTATPASGSVFSGWSGACSGSDSCILSLTAAAQATAAFSRVTHELSVVLDGNGSGSVVSDPAGIACKDDCSESITQGSLVTLVASPLEGSMFAGWSGAGCSGTGPCVITIVDAVTVTATFARVTHLLTVVRSGNGAGTVAATAPGGIDCGVDCTEAYEEGQAVVLQATPSTGSSFAGWAGGGCSGTGTCTVSMTSATAVTAEFRLHVHTLTVMRAGTGAGAVTSSPSGISCGSDCSEQFDYGTMVTLTAAASTGSTFGGWSGGGCSGTGTCRVTISAAASVTATFSLTQHTLSVLRSGTGTGTVTSSPAGINCGLDCSESYGYNTAVTLSAVAATGSAFSGWSGACTGTGTCAVTMTQARSVTASFGAVDIARPTVTSTSPANLAIGAPNNVAISVTFSEPMDRTATEAAFSVTLPAGVTGAFSWQGNTMVFTPASQFMCTSAGVTVRWGLSTGARDVAGNTLAASLAREFRVIRCVNDFFFSETGRDGHVTNTGTVVTASATIHVGDFANNTHSRGFVSFDISTIPSNAEIIQGWIQMWMTRVGAEHELGQLILEPVVYGTLDAADYSLTPVAPAGETNAIEETAFWMLTDQVADGYRNRATRGNRFQVRLRPTIDFLLNGSIDGYDFVSAEGGGITNSPVLSVSYKIP